VGSFDSGVQRRNACAQDNTLDEEFWLRNWESTIES
jgi:hypothetical protein